MVFVVDQAFVLWWINRKAGQRFCTSKADFVYSEPADVTTSSRRSSSPTSLSCCHERLHYQSTKTQAAPALT